MIYAIIGPSGAGKTKVADTLEEQKIFLKVPSYTTRSMRPGERNGVDYHFVSVSKFKEMEDNNEFIETEEYTQNRFYGTSRESVIKASLSNEAYAMVLTPNGFRKIQKEVGEENIISCMITSSLGTRVKRYIDRCGENDFNFDDMNEIYRRVNSDYGMFLGMEKEVDYVFENNGNDLSTIYDIVNKISDIHSEIYMDKIMEERG